MKKENEQQRLQSYQNIWTHDKRVYEFLGFVFPQANGISVSELGYFVSIEMIVIILNRTLQLPRSGLSMWGILIFAVKFGVIPWGLTQILKYSKLDGKKPIPFFRDYIMFFFAKNKQYEFFKDVTNIPEQREYIIQWRLCYRRWLAVPPRARRN